MPGNLSDKGEFHFPDGQVIEIVAADLIELGNLGKGTYGFVTLNKHKDRDLKFAVKHIKQQDDANVSHNLTCSGHQGSKASIFIV